MADWVVIFTLLLESHGVLLQPAMKTVGGTAHWVTMGKPREVNTLMRERLDTRKTRKEGQEGQEGKTVESGLHEL